RIDILLNTAGVLDGYAKTLDTDEALWDRIMNTNIKGTYFVTNAILPHMIENVSGVIVNMASIAGLVAGGGGAAYTASKHAIIGYTKQLDLDYCREGVRANAIAPGAIQTPMNAADFAGDGAMAEWVASETPAGRWAQPEEVAGLTLFLASNAADYIHGAVMPMDGGWTIK
ncbi:3-oxoacyl-ACP reductase, partial [Virgibacillus halodenitrificans]|nr:3-oxoacyl-ACP reductase [Virgibacillus halodenitrificans]